MKKVENFSQRMQEDCSKYPELVINIGIGIVKALVYVVVFSITLATQFNSLWLILILVYAITATIIARLIGHPLVSLNYQTQQAEATYRNKLSKPNFKKCIFIQLNLIRKIKHLQYFQSLYGQLGVVIPLLIIAPVYFTTGMMLGGLMRANYIMGVIVDNLSYGINNFSDFNKLLSCRRRLKEISLI